MVTFVTIWFSEPKAGLEPATFSLRVKRSTTWAISAPVADVDSAFAVANVSIIPHFVAFITKNLYFRTKK